MNTAKRLFTLLFVLTLSVNVQAALFNRGTDTLSNRLIYDSDLNITWYDYTRSGDTWSNQMNWASDLTVNVGGITYDDWRLPSVVDGYWHWGYDGTTTAGYNITSSEMGHLFYTELGNKGYYATDGTAPQPGWDSFSTGNFQHLLQTRYWSGTVCAANNWYAAVWEFYTYDGTQDGGWYMTYYFPAIAVRAGDVIPEPATLSLLALGGLALIRRRRMV